jgi:hypothetical protein
LGGRKYALPPRCASYGGYNLHAGVVVGAADRAGLQRLCRYVARPPLSASRLEVLEGGQVRVHLKRPWADRTAYITMTRLAFLERLASLVPPPRANTVLYHGVLASRSRLRERVRPPPPPPRAGPAYSTVAQYNGQTLMIWLHNGLTSNGAPADL